MKTVVLIDNIGDDTLIGEWGLSFYIEYGERKILLYAGWRLYFKKKYILRKFFAEM